LNGHELALALRAAYLALHRRTDALMAQSGVTADQFVVLAALAEGDALTQSDLVSRTCSDPNTLRAMLVLLERRGLIERRPHPTDGRARSVALTRRGRRVFQELWRKSASLRDRLLSALTADESMSLVTRLRQLTASLESERIESPKPGRQPPVYEAN
jgi:DNA-binding MarR family transcriptional regulator